MNKLKILLTRSMLPSDIEYIRTKLDLHIKGEYDMIIPPEFTENCLLNYAPEADVLLGPYVTETILSCATNLRLIQIPWTGVETFNFEVAKHFSVPVCNTHSNSAAVAEMCMALILDLKKKVSYHDRKMRSGSWNRDQEPLSLFSQSLSGERACIIGYGHIGKKVAELLAAFGVSVCGVNTRGITNNRNIDIYSIEHIDEAISSADINVITLPLTEATTNIVNERMISNMKTGSILINMSRAHICDEDAIYENLVNGKLAGFASDVWWKTPARGESQSFPSSVNKFWELDQVVLSPHRAGFIEGSFPHLDGAITNIVNVRKGNALENVINLENTY